MPDCLKQLKNKAGFTLAEIVIGTIILGVSIAGMLTVFVMSQHNIGLTNHRLAAINFAQDELERLKITVSPDPFPSPVTVLAPGQFGWARIFSDVAIVPGTDLTRVTVEISWNEPDPD